LVALLLASCASPRPAQVELPGSPEAADIGYGEVDKERLVEPVSEVRAEDLPGERVPTLIEMLIKHPGVRVIERPYGQTSVRVRGATSFLTDEEPLFVIDGMPLAPGTQIFLTLDPSTIESMTVLKDAGETAIYGSRGANGVILIRTKGRSG
jgi:iron complex outermembrane receptor protein